MSPIPHFPPPQAQIPQIIFILIDGIARDYVFELGEQFTQSAQARLTFSIDRGVVFTQMSDPRMEKIFHQKTSSFCAIVPQADVAEHQMQKIKRRVPLDEVRQKGKAQYPNQRLAFFDPAAIQLWQAGVTQAFQIDLEVRYRTMSQRPGGLTTGSIRFAPLLKDLSIRFADKRESENIWIGLVGPGLVEEADSLSYSPQLVEIYALFPKANYLVLDRDTRALKVLSDQCHKCKFAAYDPFMLRAYTAKIGKYGSIPASYQTLFKAMSSSLAEIALKPKNAKEMLEGKEEASSLVVKVDPKKINFREFEINTSQFEEQEKGKFDVLVATLSISNAVDRNPSKTVLTPLDTLGKFLELLKENGSLYIDALFVEKFLVAPYGEEGVTLAFKYLESLLGNRLKIETIPLSDFQPNMVDLLGTVDCPGINDVKVGRKIPNVSTVALTVITRQPEKVVSTAEEQEALKQQLLEQAHSET